MCTVVVREKLAVWPTETRDVSTRGCRIVLPRPLAAGALVRVRIDRDERAQSPLDVLGQVAWARKTEPLQAGITFLSAPTDPHGAPAAHDWIDSLVAGALSRALESGAWAAGSLGGLDGVALHLGTPPGACLDASDVAVLRIARGCGPVSAVAHSLDGLKALIRLVESGAVTVGRSSFDPEGWKRAFSLIADAASAAHREPAAARERPRPTPAGVIVPPLPETLWREAALDALAAAYVRKP